jgi:hypothetical protein
MKPATLLLSLLLASFSPAASSAGEPLLALRVLYVGNSDSPRGREFASFLKQHFAQAESMARDKFDPAKTREFDVVLLDWSQSDGDLSKTKSPLGNEKEWSKPTVLLGSAGLLVAGCWQLIGGAG